MNRNELSKEIYNTSHLTGKFLLRSGVTSNEYFDKYLFESNPKLLNEIAKHLVALIPSDTEILAGLEMGGIPIATALSIITGLPVIFVRKKAKEYGTCKFAEGVEFVNKKLLMVEDVVTSGGQLILSTNDLRKAGGIINNALCVIDRQSGGKQKLNEIGIELFPLFTMEELKK